MEEEKWSVTPQEARWSCPTNVFEFESTAQIEPLDGAVGQERAVRAFDFGFKISTHGFNVFAAGPPGTGRHASVTSFVEEQASNEPVPADWCYVYNFKSPDKPIAIEVPNGTAETFAKDMSEMIKACRAEIPRAFDSAEYERRKDRTVKEFQNKRDPLIARLKKAASAKDFSVELTSAGIITIPIVDGKLMKRQEYDELSGEDRKRIQENTESLQSEVNKTMTTVRTAEKETQEELRELDKEIAIFATGHLLDDLAAKYPDNQKILDYLQEVENDIIENLDAFRGEEKPAGLMVPGMQPPDQDDPLDKYRVNVFVSHPSGNGAPVIFEANPTYYNLFGRLEYAVHFGAMTTSFTMVKAGALQKANGGYLILNALDLLLNPFSYDALKRSLKTRESRIENLGEQFRIIPAATLQPEPIPLDVKVVLIGSRYIYDLLYAMDEDFRKLFKVKADFCVDMDRSEESTAKYASMIAAKCREDDLIHYDPSGVARIVEYGVRLAEDQKKLSTRVIDIHDLISEASYWASTNGDSFVSGDDVQRAVDERTQRSNLLEERIHEMFEDGSILVDTEGSTVGQVNGLAVISMGDYVIGKPSRITSKVYVGKAGVINIERESKLSGQIHDKAVFILSGYLGARFAADKPLAMNATIGFEQSYGMIEGDSASSTELYALLSSLSGVPLRQSIAVTGSVNQQGEIQPIGAVNRKIEGFYDVCKVKGLTGDQGVLIPRRNLKNLAVREDVAKALETGEFHLWAVDTIDEGLKVLTGVPAGGRQPDGSWEPETINARADARLAQLADNLRNFESPQQRRAA